MGKISPKRGSWEAGVLTSGGGSDHGLADSQLVQLAHQEVSNAKQRSRIAGNAFGQHLSWELLLHLYLAEHSPHPLSIKGLSELVGQNEGVMRRYIAVLASEGNAMVTKTNVEGDAYLAISSGTYCSISEYLLQNAKF